MKKVIGVYRNQDMHWVGDGFPVKNLFSYDRLGQAISPFLLLDYAAPYKFGWCFKKYAGIKRIHY